MWWCCGKGFKTALGCKQGPHESKEDEEEGAAIYGMDVQKLSNVMCRCCKEIGHTMEQCPRDPNIKTNQDPEEDIDRIMRIKDFRKLFSDTMIMTTHFLKQCIKVPKIMISTAETEALKANKSALGMMSQGISTMTAVPTLGELTATNLGLTPQVPGYIPSMET